VAAPPDGTSAGWSGGLSTDFFVYPDGMAGILVTQMELGQDIWPLIAQFQSLHEPVMISRGQPMLQTSVRA
jgi:hypothetical protein